MSTSAKLQISRKQLAKICGDDPEAIRLMEELFSAGDLALTTPELGSNSNGYYTKFSSGLMICWGLNKSSTSSASSSTRTINISFPFIFLDTNIGLWAIETSGASVFAPYSKSIVDVASAEVILHQINSNSISGYIFANWIAIGRWK